MILLANSGANSPSTAASSRQLPGSRDPHVDGDGAKPASPQGNAPRGDGHSFTRVIPMFLNRVPGKPIDALAKEFLRYILSREG